ncbi:MAG: YggS family pyridoxal phosphate-dependent enzyme [Nanoarchaeota archaeon]|nr:YggS family pyridoxal phosphate-dependent enzyme [Nanoarchaeota archaeon]
MIKENILKIKSEIPENIKIIAATKTRSIDEIKEALYSVIKIIGENYVQEAEAKFNFLKELKKTADVRNVVQIASQEEIHFGASQKPNKPEGFSDFEIHLIGHLQRNKTKKAVEIFDLIQTVDSMEIAREIDKRCSEINKIMPVLIEINIAKEENKTGCMPENVFKLAEEISKLKNIKLRGIMAIGPNFDDKEKLRPYFNEAKEIFEELKKTNKEIEILSIGMSDSCKIAIECGSNMVRIGTSIFGERIPK